MNLVNLYLFFLEFFIQNETLSKFFNVKEIKVHKFSRKFHYFDKNYLFISSIFINMIMHYYEFINSNFTLLIKRKCTNKMYSINSKISS